MQSFQSLFKLNRIAIDADVQQTASDGSAQDELVPHILFRSVKFKQRNLLASPEILGTMDATRVAAQVTEDYF